jgi:hypothetical protein
MTNFDTSKFGNFSPHFKNSILEDLSKFQRAQFSWAKQSQESDHLRLFNSRAFEAQNAFEEMNRMYQRQIASIRDMFAPIGLIRNRIAFDTNYQNLFKEFQRPSSLIALFENAALQAPMHEQASRIMQDSLQSSYAHSRRLFSENANTATLERAMNQFRLAQPEWTLPSGLIDSIGSLRALHEKFGNLNLPVLDLESASTLANLLGPEGIESQLTALGIATDGTFEEDAPGTTNKVPSKILAIDPYTLLGIILTLVIFIYQERSAESWQNKTSEQLETQQLLLEKQAKQLDSLSRLLDKAFTEGNLLREQKFVVLARIAVVRSKPKHGASVVAKLFPREVVRPISENGQWIEIEYYNWLLQSYETGWALKKYFKRIPASYSEPHKPPSS